MNGKQHEIKALWEGGGADKLCQAPFKNTRGFVLLFCSSASSHTTNPVFTATSPPSYTCFTFALLCSSIPLFTRALQVTFSLCLCFQTVWIRNLPVNSQEVGKVHPFASIAYFAFEWHRVKNEQFWNAAFCDVTKTPKMNPIPPSSLVCVHIQTWNFLQSTNFFLLQAANRGFQLFFISFYLSYFLFPIAHFLF